MLSLNSNQMCLFVDVLEALVVMLSLNSNVFLVMVLKILFDFKLGWKMQKSFFYAKFLNSVFCFVILQL